ncbi:hypothetical protein CYLTODRAFT_372721 [Cylindrobasidium torrendii FP15055 ss-10]|uniref:Aminoglycoside phosphotransferase domain-containing protein n=1 Tax=Cylindrobasidium torrendii FP15055 ss-10 TaxID=1314674 RepID=A0A0D7BH38_9AGAR|nr:hypothetical protein CYLTODRAFT_372721 [Cylindrobasidium torrendii FP15055 ss-10]
MTSLNLTQGQAQSIIDKHNGNGRTVVALKEVVNNGYNYVRNNKTYIADLSASPTEAATHSSYISIFEPPHTSSPYALNTLRTTAHLIKLIKDSQCLPLGEPFVDESASIIPFPYLMTPTKKVASSELISLADLYKSPILTPEQRVLVDLEIGACLGRLHSRVMNEYYGQPAVVPPADPSISWQETFTHIVETTLTAAEAAGYEFAYTSIRAALSRAIAFFLFDDVEVPSLIWFTGSSDDVYLKLGPTPSIAAVLPNMSRAVWGDPLMEGFFLERSEALMEGYKNAGGEPLLVFPRQKTKRMWYDLVLALVVLLERGKTGPQATWALETIEKVTESLKNAPCY